MAKLLGYFRLILAFIVLVVTPTISVYSKPLKKGFYHESCPSAEGIVRSAVMEALANDTGIPAALIRLHFHDCFVRGCDGSILIDSTPTNKAEKDSPSNLGVGGFEVIDAAKAKIESVCPNTVSCADILAFAARDGVQIAGGKYYHVPAGRRDGTVSLSTEAPENLPDASSNVKQLATNFASKGLSLEEMVVLSGSHSIGDSHCSSFSKRLYSFGSAKNSSSTQDPSLDPAYANYLMTKCPRTTTSSGTGGDDPIVPFDPWSPRKLDNHYYKGLKAHKGLLFSDQALWDTSSTHGLVQSFVDGPNVWASKFAKAMVHMGHIEVLTGSQGQIRKSCRVVN